MKRAMIIMIAIVALVALSMPGCLEDKVVQIVLTGETYADFSEDESGADSPETALIDVAAEIDTILIDNGYSRSDIKDAFVTAVYYGVTSFDQTHDWTLSGAISVRRVDGGPGPWEPIVNYESQSVAAALGQKIAAPLVQGGVDVINQALDDFLDDVNPMDPILEFQVLHSNIVPAPTPIDPMVFEIVWKRLFDVENHLKDVRLFQAKSVQEFIALAKAKPGQLNYASGGAGTTTHLASELFKLSAGVSIVHVPYKGTGQALTDLIGGQVQMMMSSMLPAIPHVKAGRLRGLAVTSARRATTLPEMPTLAESGLPGFETTSWHGMLVPAKTPKAITMRLHAEMVKTLNQPDVKERFANQGMDIVCNTPEQFAAYIKSESEKWAKVIKTIGLKPQ